MIVQSDFYHCLHYNFIQNVSRGLHRRTSVSFGPQFFTFSWTNSVRLALQASLVPEDPPPKQVRPRLVSQLLSRFLKPCLHTVAEKCDCRRKRRDNGEIRRLSHFPATVALFCDKLSHFSATVWTGFNKHRVPNKCQFRRTLEATQSCQSTIRIRVTSFLPEHLALTEIIPF